MLEILFRGKQKDTGEWVEGAFYVFYNFKSVVTQILRDRTNTVPDAFEVDPATVGQYINMRDKTGKKAFTGDITMDPQGRKWVIFDCPGGFGTCTAQEWRKRISGDSNFFYNGLSERQNTGWFTYHHTIIGNIHDNPELLEG